MRPEFVALVDDRPKLLVPRVEGECGRVADAGSEYPTGTRFAVYLPYDRTVLFDIHAAFADIAVRADAHIKLRAIGAGGHRLGPVVIDFRGKLCDFGTRPRDSGGSFGIFEAYQITLIGYVERAIDQGQAIGSVKTFDKSGLEIGLPIAVLITQQG